MKFAYIAGKYRAPTAAERQININRAYEVGVKYAKLGYFPIIPQMNTMQMDGLQPDEFWLEGTLRQMETCEVVVMCKDWEKSVGATAELARAKELNLEIIYD